MDIYDKILATDLPRGSTVLGPRAEFHEAPPTGFQAAPAEFFWPDIKFLEWAPQKWMFQAAYLANHPDLLCAPFDEPTSIDRVKESPWYLDWTGVATEDSSSQVPAKRGRPSGSAEDSEEDGQLQSASVVQSGSGRKAPQRPQPAAGGTPSSATQPRRNRAYDLMREVLQSGETRL
jgi:hypothetical protein